MIDGVAVQIDWSWTSVVVALCALAATRQLREGTLQATRRWPRAPGGGWRVAEPFRLIGRWHLVGLPLLCTESVLLEPGSDTAPVATAAPQDDLTAVTLPTGPTTPAALRGTLAGAYGALALSHIVGLISFLLVAFLLPIAVASHGLVGLIFATCLLVNSTLIASLALAWVEWRLRSAHGVPASGFRIRLQSPFSVPYAATTVLDRVLGPLGAGAVVKRLLPDAGLNEWLRPHVHDLLLAGRGDEAPALVAEIVGGLDARQTAAVSARPARCLAGERYCPRCGSCYEAWREACADCPGAPALAWALP